MQLYPGLIGHEEGSDTDLSLLRSAGRKHNTDRCLTILLHDDLTCNHCPLTWRNI